jgi:hypothetical protein
MAVKTSLGKLKYSAPFSALAGSFAENRISSHPLTLLKKIIKKSFEFGNTFSVTGFRIVSNVFPQ